MSDQKNATKFYTFHEYHTFQGYYKIRSADPNRGPDYVFNKCILHVTDWLKARFEMTKAERDFDQSEIRFLDNYPPSEIMDSDGFDVFAKDDLIIDGSDAQFDINILGIRDFGEWTLKVIEPNNGSQNDLADRLFTTDIALKKTADYVFLGVKTKCKESRSINEKPAVPFRPVFVRETADDDSLVVTEGSISSADYALNIKKLNYILNRKENNAEYELLNGVINNPDRQMPIILFPSLEDCSQELRDFLIDRFSWYMSGEAYVISDESNNGYRNLFEKMDKSRLLQKDENKNSIKEKIRNNYLGIYPKSDGKCEFEWLCINDSIKSYSSKEDEGCEEAVKTEVGKKRTAVGLSCMNRRSRLNHGRISYGDILFLSALWREYIGKTDNKAIEELNRRLKESEEKIDEIIKDNNADSEERIKKEIEELAKQHRKALEIKEKANNELIEELRKANKERSSAEKEKEAAEAELKKVSEEYNKKISSSDKMIKLQSSIVNFLVPFYAEPCDVKTILDWVEKTMGDRVTVLPKARETYKDIDRKIEFEKLRDAFILMYAYILRESNDESMPEDLYEAIESLTNMSKFTASKTGKSESTVKCVADYNHKADHHIRYSAGDNIRMFRIYFDFDEGSRKYLIVAVDHHVDSFN